MRTETYTYFDKEGDLCSVVVKDSSGGTTMGIGAKKRLICERLSAMLGYPVRSVRLIKKTAIIDI